MHHSRRKSGHASTNTSMTDVRKAGTTSDLSRPRRPQTLSRRATPQVVQKLGKNPRDREREWEEERGWEDERESFPQFWYVYPVEHPFPPYRLRARPRTGCSIDVPIRGGCVICHLTDGMLMTCEKQFVPQDERILYCSEACRKHDQSVSAITSSSSSRHSATGYDMFGANLPFYAAGHPEPRDIVPRASPSRPSSTYWSPPTTPTSANYTSAVSALRSLSIRPPSPPSPTSANATIWPFTKSAAASPSTSYTKPNFYSSTYDGGYPTSGYGYPPTGLASDRPLPSRRPDAYSRPKSIELVTPVVGR
ncbi:hypothetical protein F4775DRAFT_598495 [Biscogniauxia sp. FL1348]|nr:hypothetical protein F4775DRAFT_598495 [Biscogniauxia sp. FL1348]